MLGDIVTAQEMEKAQAEAAGDKNELDKRYETLNASLNTISTSTEEFKVSICTAIALSTLLALVKVVNSQET